jgi:hypothetical protein
MLRHAAALLARTLPIAICDFRYDFAALLDGLKDSANIEMTVQCGFDPDLYIVEVDEYGNL